MTPIKCNFESHLPNTTDSYVLLWCDWKRLGNTILTLFIPQLKLDRFNTRNSWARRPSAEHLTNQSQWLIIVTDRWCLFWGKRQIILSLANKMALNEFILLTTFGEIVNSKLTTELHCKIKRITYSWWYDDFLNTWPYNNGSECWHEAYYGILNHKDYTRHACSEQGNCQANMSGGQIQGNELSGWSTVVREVLRCIGLVLTGDVVKWPLWPAHGRHYSKRSRSMPMSRTNTW